MFEQLIAVARNTFFESIRQPIMLVVLVIATLALILANPLSAFTMEDDQRMLIDMGMSTIFLCGALLAAFVATNVLGREIENKTALTVVSKPVGRPIFVIGKYLGVATALLVAALYMCVVFALVERHTVLQTVREAAHIPSWVFGIAALLVGIGVGVWCNYFYNWVFTSTVIVVTTPLVGLAYILSMRFDENFGLQPFSEAFKPEVWLAMSLLLVAILVMTAIALAASTRLKQVMTLVVTLGVFLLGMMSDWLFGRPIGALRESWLQTAAAQGKTELVEKVTTTVFTAGDTEVRSEMVEVATVPLETFASGGDGLAMGAYQIAHSIVPNFQVLWLTDALTQGHAIPVDYVVRAAVYGGFHILAALGVAVILFQRREVG